MLRINGLTFLPQRLKLNNGKRFYLNPLSQLKSQRFQQRNEENCTGNVFWPKDCMKYINLLVILSD